MKISPERQRKILEDAVRIMEHHARYGSEKIFLESPDAVKRLFTMRAFDRKQEVFSVAVVDNPFLSDLYLLAVFPSRWFFSLHTIQCSLQ